MEEDKHSVEIFELYGENSPSLNVKETVDRLLSGIDPKHLRGLGVVVLTNSNELPRKRRRRKTLSRKRKVRIQDTRGLYHHGSPAKIELLAHLYHSPAFFGVFRGGLGL